MRIQDEVMRLVWASRRHVEGPLPGGASESQIAEFARRNGVGVPSELHEWLMLCNGPPVGPEGLYGIDTAGHLSMDRIYGFHPAWRAKGWIPLAGDECGDYYVLDTQRTVSGTHPVYFVDQQDYDTPAYIVASGLWVFLRFLLESEFAAERGEEPFWPFDREPMLCEDPALAGYSGPVPLPWDAD